MAIGRYQEWLEPEGLELLEGWARDGLTDEQLAHNIGISPRTLYNWKKRHLPIMQALKKGKEVADYEVESSLHRRAIGYEYDEITTEAGMEVKRVRKHVPPDTTAAIFWLKNRKPREWRDDKHIQYSGIQTVSFIDDIADLDSDDLRTLAKLDKE